MVSDTLLAIQMKIKGSIPNVLSAYAPQVGSSLEEKMIFGKIWIG